MDLSKYTEKDQRVIKLISDAILLSTLKNKLIQCIHMFTGADTEIETYSYSFDLAESSFFEERGLDIYDDDIREKTWESYYENEEKVDFSKCVTEKQHIQVAETIFIKWCESFNSVMLNKQISDED
ncbi:hypothetical protein SAMN05421866_0019 [Chryseobacterium oranimense]|uniref:Uncharacterized protein n=1 Tax=Chryseobacterium oranimense TaxID=421058 RepID=A0A1M5X753_9FLAO|nr:hypothetical protein [Chryseobacterium oranimense]SHH95655.1 hypothetical protein SAMN05421866_0019 [Chryseobacterium oranimense]